MNSVMCLDHLSSVYYHFGFGFFALWNFKEMSEIFALFLLIAFGFKSFSSLRFPASSDRSNTVIVEKLNRKSERRRNCDDSEVLALRRLVRMERRRADAALAEVERERAASATAAEEAMAMIQRLQREKNSIEMESNQRRRLSEARRGHDDEVIQSLASLVWSYEAELGLMRQHLGGGVDESDLCLST
ncbi:protein FLOURY 1-like [Salvia divinorum]|uniref:Protein FLOURY 1-like n=1 Tax=Salvia divinorum TaxID=28513 RepID=A0ABD1HN26_SALDI